MRGVDDHAADLFGAHLLRLRRESEKRIGFAFDEELHSTALVSRFDPFYVLNWVYPDVGEHAADVVILQAGDFGNGDALPLKVANSLHPFIGKEFIAATVEPRKCHHAITRVQIGEKLRRRSRSDVNPVGHQQRRRGGAVDF